MRRGDVLGKKKTPEPYYELAFVFGGVNRIRLWPLKRDDHSGVLIGAGGTRRSDWPARVLANDVSTIIDREFACEERSIARVHLTVTASLANPARIQTLHSRFGRRMSVAYRLKLMSKPQLMFS